MKKLNTWKVGFLGFQHVLAMYAGAVIVPLIVGPALHMNAAEVSYLIAFDLVTSGVASLIQVVGGRHFGVRLPVILGCTYTAVPPIIAIGKMQGIEAVFGAVIASGVAVMIISQFFSKVLKWFPPVVTGSVIVIIGVALIPVAMKNAAGGEGSPTFGHIENLFLAVVTILSVVLINRFFKGYVQAISVLISLVIGTIIAFFLGMVDLRPVMDAGWVRLIQPMYFGVPEFHLSAILTMTLVALVSMVESMGVFLALGEVCDQKMRPDRLKKGLRAEGMAAVISGFFSSFPHTSFSQNVGLVALSKVTKRSVVVASGLILILLGFLPKVAALTMIIPTAVLGGAMIPMFGMVISSGIRMLEKVDFHRNENLLIVACSVGVGLGAAVVPDIFSQVPQSVKLLVENGIVVGSFTAFAMNLLLNRRQDSPSEGRGSNRVSFQEDSSVEATL
ncbi:nucleobase:cation symporter-2 family protein [Paludifilum halophilum]|uniref:Xanthine permease n=1 Tax=Paludifilum halophilum TaxID=1642702 RepID=A0A235BA13_9BACL|nr:nucleobase:cation symporter-2 family protein [Paludifilum halophilum]OYD09111.1 xanthine permease [Paludifilum halophilum]